MKSPSTLSCQSTFIDSDHLQFSALLSDGFDTTVLIVFAKVDYTQSESKSSTYVMQKIGGSKDQLHTKDAILVGQPFMSYFVGSTPVTLGS